MTDIMTLCITDIMNWLWKVFATLKNEYIKQNMVKKSLKEQEKQDID